MKLGKDEQAFKRLSPGISSFSGLAGLHSNGNRHLACINPVAADRRSTCTLLEFI